MTVLRLILFFAVGIGLGVALARSVMQNERHHRETGDRARPILLYVFQLLLLCATFLVLWRASPMAFGAALAGFLIAPPVWRAVFRA